MFNFVKTFVLSWLLQLWASMWLLAAVPIKILKKLLPALVYSLF